MPSVLVVDDEEAVRSMLVAWIGRLGHDVRQAPGAEEALRLMEEEPAGVAICDVAMPGRDGVWLAGQLRRHYPECAVIMATGDQTAEVAIASLREGAVDLLSKPFGNGALREALTRGVGWHRHAMSRRRRLQTLQQEVCDHLAQLDAFFVAHPVATDAELDEAIRALVSDGGALAHARRVTALATNMALAMGIRPPELSDIQRAAALHDIGRVAMPAAILASSAPLSDEEIRIVRDQPKLVSNILVRTGFLAHAAVMVGAVFERVDGSGYPWGLRGAEIPRGSRIIAVADAHDAMTHARLHRDARTPSESLFEIQRGRGTQFDPGAVDALLDVIGLHWEAVTHRASGASGQDVVAAWPGSR